MALPLPGRFRPHMPTRHTLLLRCLLAFALLMLNLAVPCAQRFLSHTQPSPRAGVPSLRHLGGLEAFEH